MPSFDDIFRNSNNPEELFDAFQTAVNKPHKNLESYKILLGNPALSDDEIGMYTNHLAKIFPDKKFDLFLWTAEMFESSAKVIESSEKAFHYYSKAASADPTNHLPYISALKLYNYEIENPLNDEIISFAENAIPYVNKKGKLYAKLSEHYKFIGKVDLQKKYELLAQKCAERE